ncbi:MAG TPA: hypothetical protein VHP83_19965 [Aggregatilineaceae bacterium]|nr:hypothetical protein [Aggregatilineaceae bacterium]
MNIFPDTNSKSQLKLLFLILIALTLLSLIAILIFPPRLSAWISTRSRNNTIKNVEEFVGAKIPKDARELSLDAQFGELFYVRLSFKAPPVGIQNFIRNICNGVLYKNYNPFNALTTVKVQPGMHLITHFDGAYYSYSPYASNLLFGNRCQSQSAMQNILVDKTNPDLYTLRYETTFNWNPDPLAPSPIEDQLLSDNNSLYINPSEDLPFMVLGMTEIEGKYMLVTEKVCIEVGPTMYEQPTTIVGSPFEYLAKAKVKIFIDGEQVASTYITDIAHGWLLAPPQEMLDRNRFNYCFVREWEAGIHQMAVDVATVEGKHITHTWDFLVQKNFTIEN